MTVELGVRYQVESLTCHIVALLCIHTSRYSSEIATYKYSNHIWEELVMRRYHIDYRDYRDYGEDFDD